jgi:hypothetical protein
VVQTFLAALHVEDEDAVRHLASPRIDDVQLRWQLLKTPHGDQPSKAALEKSGFRQYNFEGFNK